MLIKSFTRFLSRHCPRFTVALYKGLLAILLKSCNWKVKGLSNLEEGAQGPCVLALWHDQLLLLAPLLSRYAPQFRYKAVISNSREGQLLALLADSYVQGSVVKVPHDSRSGALKKITQLLAKGEEVIIITPDGPRGPRRRLKSGIAYAAIQSFASVVVMQWCVDRCWQLNTWDRLVIPKPFATIEVSFSRPQKFASGVTLDQALSEIEAMMGG